MAPFDVRTYLGRQRTKNKKKSVGVKGHPFFLSIIVFRRERGGKGREMIRLMR